MAAALAEPSADGHGGANNADSEFQQYRSFSVLLHHALPEHQSLGWVGFLGLRRRQNAAHAADAVRRGVRCAKAGNYPAAMKHYAYALHIDVSFVLATSMSN